MSQVTDNNLLRLINQDRQYEGGGIPPAPQGGKRIPTISNLRILRNQPVIGGAKISLAWLEENIDPTDYFEISVFAGTDFSKFTKDQASLDSSVYMAQLYQAPLVVQQSPAEITIAADTRLTVTITVATRHSSGMVSDPDFQPYVTANVTPIINGTSRHTVDFMVSSTVTSLYLVDATAGNITASLPAIDTVADGYRVTLKKLDATANLVVAVPVIPAETIDGLVNYSTGTQYGVIRIQAEKQTRLWWTI